MKENPKYDTAEDKTHLVLVNGIVVKGNKILISKRAEHEPHQPGKWTIPGGKVERTQGNIFNVFEDTLTREVEEETGVKIKPEVTLLTNNTFIRSTGQHVIALTFLSYWESGEAVHLEDTSAVEWIGGSELGDFEFAPNVDLYIKMGFDYIKAHDTENN